jgi:acetylornithine deacetylase/succinyl-diaminopimelate desuccinylase-like protein
MTEKISNELIHEVLVSLRNEQRAMREEMREGLVGIKVRLSQLEGHASLMLHAAGDQMAKEASVQQVLDSLAERVERIERRLELG